MITIRQPNGQVISMEDDGTVVQVGPDIMEVQDEAMRDDQYQEYDSADYAEEDPEDVNDAAENPDPQAGVESAYRITLPNGITIESDGSTSDDPVNPEETEEEEEEDENDDEDDEEDDDEEEEEGEENSSESYRITLPNGMTIESTGAANLSTENYSQEYSSEADQALDDFFNNYQ